MEEEPTLKEELRRIRQSLEDGNPKKPKGFRMPLRGRVSKSKLRKGYTTVIVVDENGALDFQRKIIEGSTIKLDDTFHAVNEESVMTYKGKPIVILAKKRKCAINPNEGENQTYGQKHIQARMLNETISFKKKLGGLGVSIGILIIVGIIIYALVTG